MIWWIGSRADQFQFGLIEVDDLHRVGLYQTLSWDNFPAYAEKHLVAFWVNQHLGDLSSLALLALIGFCLALPLLSHCTLRSLILHIKILSVLVWHLLAWWFLGFLDALLISGIILWRCRLRDLDPAGSEVRACGFYIHLVGCCCFFAGSRSGRGAIVFKLARLDTGSPVKILDHLAAGCQISFGLPRRLSDVVPLPFDFILSLALINSHLYDLFDFVLVVLLAHASNRWFGPLSVSS